MRYNVIDEIKRHGYYDRMQIRGAAVKHSSSLGVPLWSSRAARGEHLSANKPRWFVSPAAIKVASKSGHLIAINTFSLTGPERDLNRNERITWDGYFMPNKTHILLFRVPLSLDLDVNLYIHFQLYILTSFSTSLALPSIMLQHALMMTHLTHSSCITIRLTL